MPRLLSLSLLGAALLAGPLAAHALADDQAGASAFARGDFARAVSEWAPAAAQGDPHAEFGLGEVYEQGKGDYRTADHWYSMAAEHGDVQAKYRLMLIWMAGDRGVAPDLTKAYGWMLIASEDGMKSERLTQLHRQLDAHLDKETRAAGEKFAAAWDAAHAPATERLQDASIKQAAPIGPVAAATPPAPAADAVPQPQSAGPPQPSAQPAPADQVAALAVPPPVRASDPRAKLDTALNALTCASIHTAAANGVTKIAGSVADAQARDKLAALVGEVPASDRPQIDLDIVPPPLCRSLVATDGFARDGVAASGVIDMWLEGSSVLHPGDPIQVDVKSQANATVFVRIDYFTLDDQVLHMWPTQYVANTQVAPGETRRFLYRRPGGPDPAWTVGSPPYGTELILATATRRALDLGGGLTGTAPDYLKDLTAALERERNAGRQSYVAAAFIRTAAQ